MKFKIKSNTSFILLTLYALTITLVAVFAITNNSQLKAAALGWTQNDWSLGADINAIANSTLNQTGWQKYHSKTSNVDVSTPGQIKLSDPDSNITQTSEADFNGGTVDSNTYVANGGVNLKKQNGRACSSDGECASTYCEAGACHALRWIYGVCAGIGVWDIDSGTRKWKTTSTDCVSPQCSEGLLVADNNVDFSAYPARDICKTLGGRLPTFAELNCIYTNRASLGNNFVESYYWHNQQYNTAGAFYVWFRDGSPGGNDKSNDYYVRCVKTQ